MGYPLRQTTAYSFLERLIELQKNARHANGKTSFYHVDVTGILSHPYITEAFGDCVHDLQKKIIEGRYIRIEKEFFEEYKGLDVIFNPTNN